MQNLNENEIKQMDNFTDKYIFSSDVQVVEETYILLMLWLLQTNMLLGIISSLYVTFPKTTL